MAWTRRGRPPIFGFEVRKQLAELIRVYGARPAREISKVPVSMATLIKIAREFQVELKKGRRPRQAA